jgi:dTDP-glucose pyrophosphorylase
MKNWKKAVVHPDTTIRATIEAIDSCATQIAVVVDVNNKLLGTVTDGDVRRAILKEIPLGGRVDQIMNPRPTIISSNESRESVLALMRSRRFHQIPVVDSGGCLVSIEFLDELVQQARRSNLVVLMAGGLGTRLYPMTAECPKPLLKVGSKPILETIIENFREHGFYRFYISVNYKAEMIERYFGDGSDLGIEINYIRENERMGTAGALSLLPRGISEPLLVMNADLLTKVNFSHLLTFHCEHQPKATMCVREYEFQVPYGVVRVDKHRLLGIEEKPMQRFFVNAGIYSLSPEVIEMVPSNTFFDMPTLFEKLIQQNQETAVFLVNEYWMDIGQRDDFERANGEFGEVF